MTGTAPVVRVVDDDESVRAGLRRLLGSVGLAVETFPSAQALLDADVAHAPGCLVLDVKMPDLDGFGLLSMLRGEGNPVPVVMCSGSALQKDVDRAYAGGGPGGRAGSGRGRARGGATRGG